MAGRKKNPEDQYSAHFVVFLTEKQKQQVKEKCARSGVSVSELVRGWFDRFLSRD